MGAVPRDIQAFPVGVNGRAGVDMRDGDGDQAETRIRNDEVDDPTDLPAVRRADDAPVEEQNRNLCGGAGPDEKQFGGEAQDAAPNGIRRNHIPLVQADGLVGDEQNRECRISNGAGLLAVSSKPWRLEMVA